MDRGNAAVTDAEIAALQGLGAIEDARFYRYGIAGERTLGTAHPTGPETGRPWDFAQSVAAAGLMPVPPSTD